MDFIEKYNIELLHINEEGSNKLIDLRAARGGSCYVLHKEGKTDIINNLLDVIKERYGKIGTTVLRNSALAATEQAFGPSLNIFDWQHINGGNDVRELAKFAIAIQNETTAKGNNPLFLSLGAIKWCIAPTGGERKEILSPLIIIPIKLIRAGASQPLSIEFVEDDIYFNPCFYYKLKEAYGANTADNFPLPQNTTIDQTLDIFSLDLDSYFKAVSDYIEICLEDSSDREAFSLVQTAALAAYKHGDICMYYDIKRNKDYILSHPIIQRMFTPKNNVKQKLNPFSVPKYVLPYDAAQENIIIKVMQGESLLIKGPPGTGKTQTIANMIASLIHQGKRVLFVSKKVSALGEVCRKLPQEINNFVLRLDYESETDASKISVTSIQQDLANTLRYRSDANINMLNQRYTHWQNRKAEAIKRLEKYNNFMFGKDTVASGSIYDAIDALCKHRDIAPIIFAEPKDVFECSYADYLDCLQTIKEGGRLLERLTDNYAYPIDKSLWLGVGKMPIPDEFAKGVLLAKKLADTDEQIKAISGSSYGIISSLRLGTIFGLDGCSSKKIAELISKDQLQNALEYIVDAANVYRQHKDNILSSKRLAPKLFEDTVVLDYSVPTTLDGDITLYTLNQLANDANIYNNKSGVFAPETDIKKIKELLSDYWATQKAIKDTQTVAKRIFCSKALADGKNASTITKAAETLQKYIGTPATKPQLLDLPATRSINKLTPLLSSGTNADFQTTCLCVCAAADSIGKLPNKANAILKQIKQILSADVTHNAAERLYFILKKFDKAIKENIKNYYNGIMSIVQATNIAASKAGLSTDSTAITVSKLCEIYEAYKNFRVFVRLADKANTLLNDPEIFVDEDNITHTAALLSALREVNAATENIDTPNTIVNVLAEIIAETDIIKRLEDLFAFVQKRRLSNEYTLSGGATLGDLNLVCSALKDKSQAQAAIDFFAAINKDKPLSIKAFFLPFIVGNRKEYMQHNFADIFEHSFYFLLVKAISQRWEASGFSTGQIEQALADVQDAANQAITINKQIIAHTCTTRYNKDDTKFDFLKTDRSIYKYCRLFFKQQADVLLSLKRCFIMSPSTVSLLLRPDDYRCFDVVIADEASQLPPEYIIPAVFRASQCIIVGDEWQMPPIKHFVRSSSGNEDDGMEEITSAMELCIANNAFGATELVSHYRSKTESLIAYSLKRYYRNMQTFPAVKPIAEGVGVYDIYVQDGYSVAGENEAEAKAVVARLKQHFSLYYDADDGLKESIGIVVFGEKQLDLINNLIAKDKELSKKINFAISKTDDDPEKTYFIRTIENVQGRETGHLILSLTYGRTAAGDVRETFGQLNRSSLGERIFNVAVTRAQSSITLIHSVLAEDIESASLGYIKEYLAMVRLLSDQTKHGFVTGSNSNNFVQSVASFVLGLGIDPQRVVLDYGVTNNSVRIPIAILSSDLTEATLGIICETPSLTRNYLDHNLRYTDTLTQRGWNLYRIFAYDWVSNAEAIKDRLAAKIKQILQQI